MMKPLNGHVLLYMYIYLHDHDYVMDFYLWWYYVVLQAPMDDLWQVAYGEMLLSLYWGCMGVDS